MEVLKSKGPRLRGPFNFGIIMAAVAPVLNRAELSLESANNPDTCAELFRAQAGVSGIIKAYIHRLSW